MKIERFEDLKCWQESRNLVNMVYRAIKESRSFQKDLRLCGQITDASVSSMSNIAEGFSRRSGKEFIQFLFISKSSATEVQSEAYVALDQQYIGQDTFNEIYEQAEKVSKLNSGLITYLLKNQKEPKHEDLKTTTRKELNKLNKRKELNKLNERNELKEPNEHPAH